jgi:hypothetical protein
MSDKHKLLTTYFNRHNLDFLEITGYINFIENSNEKNQINNIISEKNFTEDNI